ncbi:MAG: hypothetical protein Q7S03_03615 [bacterium]|nr:hypothetical protein [bacterium]
MGRKILLVAVFAIAFGFVEAAVVVYLRTLIRASLPELGEDKILLILPGIAFLEPRAAVEIIRDTTILRVEMIREVATLVMLGTVGLLLGRSLRERVSFFFLTFSIWDLFYYLFLRLAIGWPASLGDLDIFFLLPTPWVGPVIVPIFASIVIFVITFFFLFKCYTKPLSA